MSRFARLVVVAAALGLACAWAAAAAEGPAEGAQQQAAAAESPRPNLCATMCHANPEFAEIAPEPRLVVRLQDLALDIHWQKGLLCADCHGGDPNTSDFAQAHSAQANYRSVKNPVDIPGFCGHCHSSTEYMRRYLPSPRVDQEEEYWSSGHGQKLKESGDKDVANCVSCHGHHGILAVTDLKSPVYATNVAETCATCHADEQKMAGRKYNDRDIGHEQYQQWRESVHGVALLTKGDLAAPTCNDCHGNHGALPPDVDSVANVCGVCHGKIADLFAQTKMKHGFELAGLPGCATCHGDHAIRQPSDEFLGMDAASGAVCGKCHEGGQFGATVAGADAAKSLRQGLEELKSAIAAADAKLDEAERLGMEVRAPRFDLRGAVNSLTSARTLVHTFSLEPVQTALSEGQTVAGNVMQRAEGALEEHTARRWWLAASLAPILVVVVLLLRFIRVLGIPQDSGKSKP